MPSLRACMTCHMPQHPSALKLPGLGLPAMQVVSSTAQAKDWYSRYTCLQHVLMQLFLTNVWSLAVVMSIIQLHQCPIRYACSPNAVNPSAHFVPVTMLHHGAGSIYRADDSHSSHQQPVWSRGAHCQSRSAAAAGRNTSGSVEQGHSGC